MKMIRRKFATFSRIYENEGISGIKRVVIEKFDGIISERKLKKIQRQASLTGRFSEIYRLRYWQTRENKESSSGAGSTKARSAHYLQQLQDFLSEWTQTNGRQIIFFDAPCGDLNWIHPIFTRTDVQYHGADIVPSLISQNQLKFANETIMLSTIDITKDAFPRADIWHCRDCFFHLSYRNIFLALENFVRSEVPLALLTSHAMGREHCNWDINDGDFRPLDLTKAPFNFPQPDIILSDGGDTASDPPRIVGLYTRETIRQILDDRSWHAAE